MSDRDTFLARFGGVYEHSAWVAERAWDHGRITEPLTVDAVQAALATEFRAASADERLAVLRAHPDLAGKLAIADQLTQESRSEQAGAGLDRLSPEELLTFTALNSRYVAEFGFPFIIAVKGLTKDDILTAFEARIANSAEQEFTTACAQVERIAGLRIAALLGEPASSAETGKALPLESLTREAFAAFGTVLDTAQAELRMINGGTTERFHALAIADTSMQGGSTILSLFRGQPRAFPYEVTMMERHPLGSQAFFPMSGRDWIAVVAADDNGKPGKPRAFCVPGTVGLQYGRNVWHHPLIAVGEVADFLVMDRDGPGDNLEEIDYPAPYSIPKP